MITNAPRFALDEQLRLLALSKSGDREATDLLCRSILPWALKCAMRHRGERSDLEECAILGAWKAVQRWQPERGSLTGSVYWNVRSEVSGMRSRTARHRHGDDSDSLARVESRPEESPEQLETRIDRIRLANALYCRVTRDRDFEVLFHRMEGETLEQVGDRFKMSKERVRQLQNRALDEIRTSLAAGVSTQERAESAASASSSASLGGR